MDIQEAIDELRSMRDLIRWGTSRFAESDIWYGHGTDNPLDEAAAIVFAALNLPHHLNDGYLASRVTRSERERILGLFKRRVEERLPVPYLTHEAWFLGMPFYVDERVLIPRSPIGELIESRFSPWIGEREIGRILDVGTGSGCIAIACAHAFPEAFVDAVDIDPDALAV
ncbi:MAG: HemK family protein methyltransferase, partial [Gammaproteobacteria bacterium]